MFHEMIGEHTSEASEVVVGTETDRGLWVHALVGAGYRVYAINPKAVLAVPGPSPPGGSEIRPWRRQGVGRIWYEPTVHNHSSGVVAGGDSSPRLSGIKVLARTASEPYLG